MLTDPDNEEGVLLFTSYDEVCAALAQASRRQRVVWHRDANDALQTVTANGEVRCPLGILIADQAKIDVFPADALQEAVTRRIMHSRMAQVFQKAARNEHIILGGRKLRNHDPDIRKAICQALGVSNKRTGALAQAS